MRLGFFKKNHSFISAFSSDWFGPGFSRGWYFLHLRENKGESRADRILHGMGLSAREPPGNFQVCKWTEKPLFFSLRLRKSNSSGRGFKRSWRLQQLWEADAAAVDSFLRFKPSCKPLLMRSITGLVVLTLLTRFIFSTLSFLPSIDFCLLLDLLELSWEHRR